VRVAFLQTGSYPTISALPFLGKHRIEGHTKMGAGTSVIPCPEANVPVGRDITAELASIFVWSRELVVSPLSVHRLWNQDGRQEFSGGPNVIGEPSSHGRGALLPTCLFCLVY